MTYARLKPVKIGELRCLGAPKLTADKVAKIVELQSVGRTYAQIDAALDIHINTVWRCLSAHNRRVLERLSRRGESEKARQVEILMRIVSEAMSAWDRSKADAVTVKTTTGAAEAENDTAGEKTEVPAARKETTRKGQAGAPAFLAEARSAMADVRKILGLDEADASEATGAALAAVAAVLEKALEDLPDDLRAVARERIAAELLELRTPPRGNR